MEDLNVAIRLKGFIDAEGLTHSQFADRCGIPRPSLSQILSGRNKKISDVIVGQIHQAFPKLSVLWLLFGEGPMITPEPAEASPTGENGNSGSENSKFAVRNAEPSLFENVGGLSGPRAGGQSVENKGSHVDLKIADLQRQIDKLRNNPRKVTQITVYYDDSTFETFYPRK